MRHGGGALARERLTVDGLASPVERAAALAREAWPPAGCEAVGADEFYDALAGMGIEYGPVFQGLRAAWRRGEEAFAEVSLVDRESGAGGGAAFGVHPALLDAVLQSGAVSLVGADRERDGSRGAVRLPFSFNGVELHARGASSLRVSMSLGKDEARSLLVVDDSGGLVASIDSWVAREVPMARLGAPGGAHRDSLFAVRWRGLPAAAQQDGAVPEVVLFDCGPAEGDDGPAAARELAERVLAAVQSWLAEEHRADSRLALITHGAVDTGVGDHVPALAHSPVWGLVRSAQSEHPERFVLVDVDGAPESWEAVMQGVARRRAAAGDPQGRNPRAAAGAHRWAGRCAEHSRGGRRMASRCGGGGNARGSLAGAGRRRDGAARAGTGACWHARGGAELP